jgi:hypothetical protein
VSTQLLTSQLSHRRCLVLSDVIALSAGDVERHRHQVTDFESEETSESDGTDRFSAAQLLAIRSAASPPCCDRLSDLSTAGPISKMVPVFSCPRMSSDFKVLFAIAPRYMCRSEPQMFDATILMITP